jgi:hypothetical protein
MNNELRIGNWIQDGNEFEQITIDHLNCLYSGRCEYDPIPLTEEWLLKFGFEYKVEELGVRFYEIQIGISFISLSIEGHFNINSGESYWYMDRDFKAPKYVHQLQNLYFALTGEELTIKNK